METLPFFVTSMMTMRSGAVRGTVIEVSGHPIGSGACDAQKSVADGHIFQDESVGNTSSSEEGDDVLSITAELSAGDRFTVFEIALA